jgi:hypothetical protein
MAAKATMLGVTSCVDHALALLLLKVGCGGLSSIRVGPNRTITIILKPDVSSTDRLTVLIDTP